MKEKLVIFVLYALISSSNCIKVIDSENVSTTIEPELKSENVSEAQVTEKDSNDVTTTPNYMYKIPPTLQNVKTTRTSIINKESIQPASIVHSSPQMIPDGKLKQAILHSKTQNFKNMEKINLKANDQVHLEARPEEQTEKTKITPPAPTAKEFIPSPELTNLFHSDNKLPDHFQPMNQYQRTAMKHNAHFSSDNFFRNHALGTKWLGNNRPTEPEVYPFYLAQHGTRNTHVDYPQLNHGHHLNYHVTQRPNNEYSSMVFPTDSSLLNLEEVIRTVPALPTKLPGIKTYDSRSNGGSWKWIPDSEDEVKYFNPETKFTQFDYVRHQTVRDRPYSFESSDIYTQHTTPTSGGSEEGEVNTNTGRPNSEEAEKIGFKYYKPPSPWKRIIHVMTAAIPIGILISALTPRIVYVHPNATVPTAIPPLAQQQQPPPPIGNLPPSNSINPPPSPLRQRQRGILEFNNEINAFLRIMDMQFKEKHRGHRMDAKCEDRFFCEVALMGAKPNSSRMHKTLYHFALETPRDQAEKSGLSEIFTAIQRQNCQVFKCKKL